MAIVNRRIEWFPLFLPTYLVNIKFPNAKIKIEN